MPSRSDNESVNGTGGSRMNPSVTSTPTTRSKRKALSAEGSEEPNSAEQSSRTLRRKRRDDDSEFPTDEPSADISPPPDLDPPSPSLAVLDSVSLIEADPDPNPIDGIDASVFIPPPMRGRGRGRGRGARGGRGGRPRLGSHPVTGPTARSASPRGMRAVAGRVKRSSDARTQSLRTRKQVLRLQYRQVARVLRGGLLELSGKSLEQLKEDPDMYTKVPEYSVVQDAVTKTYQERVGLLSAQRRTKENYQRSRKDKEDEYVEASCQHSLDEIFAKYESQLLQRAMKIVQQEGDPHSHYVRVNRTPAQPHPATVWLSMSADERAAEGRKTRSIKGGRKRGRAATTKGSSLLPLPTAAAFSRDFTYEDFSFTLDSVAPTPHRVGTPSLAADLESDELDSDDDPGGASRDIRLPDKYGVYFPPKPRKDTPVLRMAQPVTVMFGEDEIGIRVTSTTVLKNGDIKVTSGPPNPKHFFQDRYFGGYETLELKGGDFDQELIKAHTLHPKHAIPLVDSINPVSEPRDWSEPLPRYKSIKLLAGPPGTLDEDCEVIEASRSASMLYAEEDYWHMHRNPEERPQSRMTTVLEAFNDPKILAQSLAELHQEIEQTEDTQNEHLEMLINALKDARIRADQEATKSRRLRYDPVREAAKQEKTPEPQNDGSLASMHFLADMAIENSRPYAAPPLVQAPQPLYQHLPPQTQLQHHPQIQPHPQLQPQPPPQLPLQPQPHPQLQPRIHPQPQIQAQMQPQMQPQPQPLSIIQYGVSRGQYQIDFIHHNLSSLNHQHDPDRAVRPVAVPQSHSSFRELRPAPPSNHMPAAAPAPQSRGRKRVR